MVIAGTGSPATFILVYRLHIIYYRHFVPVRKKGKLPCETVSRE